MTRKGFTLIELLVVVAVLALLASIVFSNLGGAREGARISNALSFQSQTHSLLGSDLVGWWNFNEGDARDISGYGNNGTIYGATHVDGVPGTGGNALSFDGVDDYVEMENGESLKFGSGNFSLALWVNLKEVNKTQVFIYHFVDSDNNFMLWYDGSNLRLQTKDSGIFYRINLSVSLEANKYYHIIGLFNGSHSQIYIDGDYKGQGNINTAYMAVAWPGRMVLGTRPTAWDHWLNGLIDDIRIYSRALTASEVQNLYAQTKDRYLADK